MSDPPSPSLRRGEQFFSELKRRNVYKIAIGTSDLCNGLVQPQVLR